MRKEIGFMIKKKTMGIYAEFPIISSKKQAKDISVQM
jgi:hypothetical protein